jgi:hypothetical protein
MEDPPAVVNQAFINVRYALACRSCQPSGSAKSRRDKLKHIGHLPRYTHWNAGLD